MNDQRRYFCLAASLSKLLYVRLIMGFSAKGTGIAGKDLHGIAAKLSSSIYSLIDLSRN
jgi:hypothetical protein